jgi:hypothetical protein
MPIRELGVILMLRAIRKPSGSTIQIVSWLALPAILSLAPGCSGSADKKPKASTAVAQSAPAQDAEETDAAPAQPPKKQPKKAVEKKPAEPELPAPSTADVTKWKADDLNAALVRKDVKFIMGAMFFGMKQMNSAKSAADLDGLLQKVAKLKDDPAPEVPIPAGLLAEADTDEPADAAAKHGAPAAAAAAATPKRGGSPFRMGGMRRGGDGGK